MQPVRVQQFFVSSPTSLGSLERWTIKSDSNLYCFSAEKWIGNDQVSYNELEITYYGIREVIGEISKKVDIPTEKIRFFNFSKDKNIRLFDPGTTVTYSLC